MDFDHTWARRFVVAMLVIASVLIAGIATAWALGGRTGYVCRFPPSPSVEKLSTNG